MFQEYNISALTDIETLLEGFATDAGWTVGVSSGGLATFTPPGGAVPIEMQYQQVGTLNNTRQCLFFRMPADAPVITTFISNPRSGTVSGAPTHTPPTKLSLFGDERFLAGVVSYGYNRYRHFYLGVMEHLGDYTGREVISATTAYDTRTASTSVSFRQSENVHLFSANHGQQTAPLNLDNLYGGVHIVHADEPLGTQYRPFTRPANAASFAANFAAGGFKDDVNDAYLARAKSEYAGQHILTPINLFAAQPSNNWKAIGRPPGIRLVSMEGIEPEQSILVGTKQWRCFPQSTKRLTTTHAVSDGVIDKFPDDDGSYLVGYAYQEEE